jgi:hypothetical protein
MSRASLPPELRDVAWPSPWIATDAPLHDELAREVSPRHPLAGRRALAIARRGTADDVLFWLPDGPALLAMVHLTWRHETDPEWPFTQLFDSVEAWMAFEQEDRAS